MLREAVVRMAAALCLLVCENVQRWGDVFCQPGHNNNSNPVACVPVQVLWQFLAFHHHADTSDDVGGQERRLAEIAYGTLASLIEKLPVEGTTEAVQESFLRAAIERVAMQLWLPITLSNRLLQRFGGLHSWLAVAMVSALKLRLAESSPSQSLALAMSVLKASTPRASDEQAPIDRHVMDDFTVPSAAYAVQNFASTDRCASVVDVFYAMASAPAYFFLPQSDDGGVDDGPDRFTLEQWKRLVDPLTAVLERRRSDGDDLRPDLRAIYRQLDMKTSTCLHDLRNDSCRQALAAVATTPELTTDCLLFMQRFPLTPRELHKLAIAVDDGHLAELDDRLALLLLYMWQRLALNQHIRIVHPHKP